MLGPGFWKWRDGIGYAFRAGQHWRCGDCVHASRGPYRTMRGAMRAAMAIRWAELGPGPARVPDRVLVCNGLRVGN